MTEQPANPYCGVLQHTPTSVRNTQYDIRNTRYKKRKDVRSWS